MQGKIVKGIAGFYYVQGRDGKKYECKAKGGFRREGVKPLVGDDVEIRVLDEDGAVGNIESILPRKNQLIRPAVANVDQALVLFSMTSPEPNLNLLDRFLIMMQWQGIDTVIGFSKRDLVDREVEAFLCDTYVSCGVSVIPFSNRDGSGVEEIRKCMMGCTTVLAGPSGVGKSSLVNEICPEAASETGGISEKIGRGKHTTRHSELYAVGKEGFLFDTPGFSSLNLPDIGKDELRSLFTEFALWENQCRFQGCSHIHEPGCAVKREWEKGRIRQSRYRNYVQMYEELAESAKRNYGRNRK